MENQPPIQNNIFLSGSLCVELYSHCLLCCREKVCVRVVFGRAYHWVISSISKQSTSTDVTILVNVIPAWQHAPRKQPSQTEYFFFFCSSQSLQSVMEHGYFRFDCTLYSISQWMKWKKKMAMKWAQHKYTNNSVCTVNRWRAWKMLEQWLMLITARHRDEEEYSSFHHCFHHLCWEGKCLRLPMTCGVMNDGR